MKVLSVFGTRPEAIKMCPVLKEFEKRKSLESIVCLTGQHEEMINQVIDLFGIYVDYNMHLMKQNQTLSDITADMLCGINEIIFNEKPNMVLVHGDTTSSFVAALSALYNKIPVAHVEAGLRTYDIQSPYPEEFNRQAIDLITDIYFAPTEHAKRNLMLENKKADQIYVTGNTVIDALKSTVDTNYNNELLEWCRNKKLILLTAHRRENIGTPMEHIFKAVCDIADKYSDINVLYPVHKNPKVRETAKKYFCNKANIKMIEPLDVYDFHNIMSRCYLILTDSGGVQEEALALGKPTLVLRNVTERREGLEVGTLKLVGTDTLNIINEIDILLNNSDVYLKMSKANNSYGDGHAAERIVDVIEKYFEVR